jgi:hypothetical protein
VTTMSVPIADVLAFRVQIMQRTDNWPRFLIVPSSFAWTTAEHDVGGRGVDHTPGCNLFRPGRPGEPFASIKLIARTHGQARNLVCDADDYSVKALPLGRWPKGPSALRIHEEPLIALSRSDGHKRDHVSRA